MTTDIKGLPFDIWLYFYSNQAGLLTDNEFARILSSAKAELISLEQAKETEKSMLNAAHPLLIQSALYYLITTTRDRNRSFELLQEAVAQGDVFASELMTKRNEKW